MKIHVDDVLHLSVTGLSLIYSQKHLIYMFYYLDSMILK